MTKISKLGEWWYNLSYNTQEDIRTILFVAAIINIFFCSLVFWRQFL